MKKFLEYLLEAVITLEALEVENILSSKGFQLRPRTEKTIANSIIVEIPNGDDRVKALEDIAVILNGVYDKNLKTYSSIGAVRAGNVKVYVKNVSKSYDGKAIRGQSEGEHAEAGVAYIFNKLNAINLESELIDEAHIDDNIRSVLTQNGLSEEWILSSYASALKILSEGYSNKNYLAVHVNGNDFMDIPEDIRKVADIFYGKEKLVSSLQLTSKKDLKKFNDLYVKSKDNWNKADIVLINKVKDIYSQILQAGIVDSMSLNGVLNTIIEDLLDIIPISLKKIIPDAKLSQIKFEKEGNINTTDQEVSEISQVKDVKLKWPERKLDNNSLNCSCYLVTDNGLKIQFRKASGAGNNLSIELILKGARGGKPTTQVKNDLKMMSADSKYYEIFTSEEDFYKKLINALKFDPGKIPEKVIAGVPNWYNRVCFQGLVGVLDKYNKVYSGKTLKDFFQYLHTFASGNNSKSIFYLLTMR